MMAYQSFLYQQYLQMRAREYALIAEQQLDELYQQMGFLPPEQINFDDWNHKNAFALPQGHGDLVQNEYGQDLIVHWGKPDDHYCTANRSGLSGCRRRVLA